MSSFHTNIRRFGPWLCSLVFGAAGWAASTGAMAAPVSCTQSVSTVALSMPTAVSVPRDAVQGTPLTGWVVSADGTRDWFRCTDPAPSAIGPTIAATPGTLSGVTYVDGGVSYPVFKTSLDGVGIAIGFQAYVGGCGLQTFQPVWGGYSGTACNSAGTWNYGGLVRARLIKTGVVKSGTVGGGAIATGRMSLNGTANTSQLVSITTTTTRITSLTCVTPDVIVAMGSHPRADFDAADAKSAPVDVNIALKQCPAGMNQIQYRVEPLTEVVDAANGIVKLSTGSTASGVALQLLDGNLAGFPLGTNKVFASYGTATGGDYAIKLKARYVKTGPVRPGTADAVMSLVMTYN